MRSTSISKRAARLLLSTRRQLPYRSTGQAEPSYRTQDSIATMPLSCKGAPSLALALAVDAIADKLTDLKPADPLAKRCTLDEAYNAAGSFL